MYNWIILLYSWNWHSIVDQLYSNTKSKVKKNKLENKPKKNQKEITSRVEFFLHSTEDNPYTDNPYTNPSVPSPGIELI